MPNSSGKFRLSVQAKVLLVVLGFLVLLPVLMVWIVDRQTNRLVLQQEQQALTSAKLVLQKSLEIRGRNQLVSYRNVVIEPSFKAAVAQRDA
ncbi:MAG: hypothetical protein H7343_16405, partial [Undibacterium sp.]|nr:hypothetical protein [Opitutaceae bacterium]